MRLLQSVCKIYISLCSHRKVSVLMQYSFIQIQMWEKCVFIMSELFSVLLTGFMFAIICRWLPEAGQSGSEQNK